MVDERLKDKAWRLRTGFDNIDPLPGRKSLRVEREDISRQIDRELFGRKHGAKKG